MDNEETTPPDTAGRSRSGDSSSNVQRDDTTIVETDHQRSDDVVIADQRSDTKLGDNHLTDAEVTRVRTLLNDGSLDDERSRIKWFLLGFLAALLAIVVAAAIFLVVSDDDSDGDVDLEVPNVDLDVEG